MTRTIQCFHLLISVLAFSVFAKWMLNFIILVISICKVDAQILTLVFAVGGRIHQLLAHRRGSFHQVHNIAMACLLGTLHLRLGCCHCRDRSSREAHLLANQATCLHALHWVRGCQQSRPWPCTSQRHRDTSCSLAQAPPFLPKPQFRS